MNDLQETWSRIIASEMSRVRGIAEAHLAGPLWTITSEQSALSEGDAHDFYSTGDYWWPDLAQTNGLPYMRQDGLTNPDGFYAHRNILRGMRYDLGAFTVAAASTMEVPFAQRAEKLLQVFFLDKDTRMRPSLNYAQAIPGICSGRGIGIIDTLHLIEVPLAVNLLANLGMLSLEVVDGMREWFAKYLHWMKMSDHGKAECQEGNNHTTAWALQVGVFAWFTGDVSSMDALREDFPVWLEMQLGDEGSFPLELARTKPYNYSLFNLDCWIALAHVLSIHHSFNGWDVQLPSGASLDTAMAFHMPYIEDKSSWPYPMDVSHFEALPGRRAALFFDGIQKQDAHCLKIWNALPAEIADPEIRRNLLIRQPLLWVPSSECLTLPWDVSAFDQPSHP